MEKCYSRCSQGPGWGGDIASLIWKNRFDIQNLQSNNSGWGNLPVTRGDSVLFSVCETSAINGL